MGRERGGAIFPTIAQATICTQLAQNLTALYIPIYLVRLDERTDRLLILAGEEIEIEIQPDGVWEFLHEP